MKTKAAIFCLALFLSTAAAVHAEDHFYDFGTRDSEVWPGFERVTPAEVFAPTKRFGWQTGERLTAFDCPHAVSADKQAEQTELSPLWTNAITEGAIVGDHDNTFFIGANPGEYQVYVVCGAGKRFSAQFFDFTVRVGNQEERVQVEEGCQFRCLRFKATVGQEPLTVAFRPRSKWIANAIMAWPVADTNRVEKTIIAPFEEWTYRLPPDVWAKWKQEPDLAGSESAATNVDIPSLFSPKDRERGFGVFSRPYLECIYPHTPPQPKDVNPELRLFASPGEYEPANFIVYPFKNLSGVRVSASDLGPVATRDIDIRRVRCLWARLNYKSQYKYRVVPDVLEHFTALDLAAGENARFWLTVHVPEDAKPGEYAGSVRFQCEAGEATIPVRLRVLPIRLREDPEKIYAIYYDHPCDRMFNTPDDVSREYFRRRAELEHQDLVAHGIRNIVLSAGVSPTDTEGKFEFHWDLLAAKLELWKKYQFRGPIVMGVDARGIYAKYMHEMPGAHLRSVKDPPDAFGRELTAMVRAIEDERRKRDWPEFLYYPIDEPSASGASVKFMAKVLQACKAAEVRTYLTADPTRGHFAPLKPYVDVWCTQPFSPDRETVLADSKARSVEYWCYPNHVNGENDHTPVAGARMTYGFGFWRSGFRALIPWIYSADIGDPLNYLDEYTMDFLNRHEPDGTPMPVVLWEAYREGYDDYRYVYTLEQLIAEAKKSPRKSVRQAAETAEHELEQVWDAIRVQPKYKYDGLWAFDEFDGYRWKVAQQIVQLQEVMTRNSAEELLP
jgi:hypothetical protein